MSRELRRSDENDSEPRVVEGEVVGGPRPANPAGGGTWLGRLAARAILAAVLGLIALALLAAGAVLTLTVVGAVVGVPLLLLGLALAAAALWIFFGGGTMTVWHAGNMADAKGENENENGD
ncbi:MAG TPA: hypothetical protein VNH15_05625 [Elusimicrobiota bacterium]|nr:hypothetical protein [Elusimicrobiota bacterium]